MSHKIIDNWYYNGECIIVFTKIVIFPYSMTLTKWQISCLSNGSLTIALEKYLQSIMLLSKNFTTSQYGIQVQDFEYDFNAIEPDNPLYGEKM